MKRMLILIVSAGVVLGACASGEVLPDATSADAVPSNAAGSSSTAETPIPVEPNEGIGDGALPGDLPVVPPTLADEVETARADLGQRIGDDRIVEVLVAHELTWPDGSLGCPQPDMSYTQVLVDGYRIVFADGTHRFVYHGSLGSDPFLCAEGDETSPELAPLILPSPSTTIPPIEVLPTDPAKDDEPTEQFGGPSGPPDE